MIYPNCSRADYEALEGVNWSSLKKMGDSPKAYRYWRENPEADKAAWLIGRAVDCLVLQPELWEDRFAVFGGTRRQAAYAEFAADNGARDVLTSSEMEAVERMTAAADRSSAFRHELAGADTSVAVTWEDEGTGLLCKGLLDATAPGVAELKTSDTPNPAEFCRQAANYGYHGQLAFYVDGLAANMAGELIPPVWLVLQKREPFDAWVLDPGEAVTLAGRQLYRPLLERLKECQERGEWPGATEPGKIAAPWPAWTMPAEEDQPLTLGGVSLEF